MLTKPIPHQRGHKMYLIMCWTNPTNPSEDSKCMSTWVDQTDFARTQNASQFVLIKPLPCQWGQKMNLNLCWALYASEVQSLSQHLLTNPLPCHRGVKMHLNKFCPNESKACKDTKWISSFLEQTSHAIKETKCILTCVDQTPPMPARTQSVSHVFTQPFL